MPSYAVHLVRAGTIEPGDLLLGPDLGVPARVWWVSVSDTQTALLLTDGGPHWRMFATGQLLPVTVRPDPHEPCADAVERLFVAACAATWLREHAHPAGPSEAVRAGLIAAYASASPAPRAHARVAAVVAGLTAAAGA